VEYCNQKADESCMTDEKYEVKLLHHGNLLDNLLTHEFPDEKAPCWMRFIMLNTMLDAIHHVIVHSHPQ